MTSIHANGDPLRTALAAALTEWNFGPAEIPEAVGDIMGAIKLAGADGLRTILANFELAEARKALAKLRKDIDPSSAAGRKRAKAKAAAYQRSYYHRVQKPARELAKRMKES